MAPLRKKGNGWYWQKRRFTFAVGRATKAQAQAKATRADEIVGLLEQGVLKLPQGMEVVAFVKHDGQPPAPPNRR
jgi:hypothetical protein